MWVEECDRMNKKLLTFFSIGISILIVIIVFFSLLIVQSAMTRPEPNKVIASNSWIGRDQTNYYNITIAYKGGEQTYLLTCNLFPINSTAFPLRYYPPILFIHSSIGIDGRLALPIGC